MKPENKDLMNSESNNNQKAPTASFSSRADVAGPAPGEREKPAASLEVRSFSRPLFVVTGVAICMGLSSCIVPYDSYGGGGSATVTTYRPGYRVDSLPGGYRSETISGNTYYYHDGYYYRRGSGGYVLVDAPRGSRHYDDYNRRQRSYQPGRDHRDASNRHEQRHERGEVFSRLPDGYRVVNHRGNTYYQVGDRYYRRDNNNYVIVSRPF